MNPKLLTLKILSLVAATALVAGCGAKTDPTSDYPELKKNSVPIYDAPAQQAPVETQSQGVLPANVFRVDMPGNMNFIEGQPNSYPVTVSTQLKDITFALSATGLPSGVTLKQVDGSHYVVSGTVPVGSSLGIQQGEKVPVTIAAVNAKGDSTEISMFNSLLHSWSPSVTVYATDKAPIVESQKLGLSVNEGDSLPISIIVTDVGSHGAQVPQIQSPFQDDMQSGEIAFVAAMPGLRISRAPEALGNSKYKFSGTLNTKLLNLPSGKKTVTARFVVNFKSPSGLVSADEIVDVKIVRTPPAAPAAAPAAEPAAADAAAADQAAAPAAAKAPVKKKKSAKSPSKKQESK
jgi:hypothetical protein